MNNADFQYCQLLRKVLEQGRPRTDRTGVGTIGLFGEQARFDLSEGFPLLTSKKLFTKGIIHELLWFISGSTNIKYLVDNDVHIWDGNAFDNYLKKFRKENSHPMNKPLTKEAFIHVIKESPENPLGELGEGIYGWGWRSFGKQSSEGYCDNLDHDFVDQGVDQLSDIIEKLKTNPDDRRLIVSAWHPYFVDKCALPPCHVLFQFHTEELSRFERMKIWINQGALGENFPPIFKGTDQEMRDKYDSFFDKKNIPKRQLNCQLYQRSCDLFLGVPFNIASYALLTSMVAQVVNMIPGDFIHTYGDLHIYSNHIPQAKEQLERDWKKLPTLKLNPNITSLFDFKYEDIVIEGYDPHPAIKAEMAV